MSPWEKVSLPEVCQIKPPKKEAKKNLADTDLVSFVPMKNLGMAVRQVDLNEDRPLKKVYGSYTYFVDNDVLLAKITPCFENGKLGIVRGLTNGVGFGSSEYIVFRSKGDIMPEYLLYFLSQDSFRYAGAQVMTGAVGHKRVSKEFIENQLIPLPPLPEQQRIVSILDEVFEGIGKAVANVERNLENSRELFESYLEKIFLKQGEGWEEKPLSLACIVERGSSPRPIKKYLTDEPDGVNWVKIGDTKGVIKYIHLTKQKITKEGAKKSRKVNPGDFILTNSMTYGRPYIMMTNGYIHDGWFVLRLAEGINSDFFYYLLSSQYVQKQFQNLAAGAIVKNISSDLVKKTILPIPKFFEQKRLVKDIEKVASKIQKLEKIYQQKFKSLEELKQSILQKAFTGELTAKTVDKIMEPVSV